MKISNKGEKHFYDMMTKKGYHLKKQIRIGMPLYRAWTTIDFYCEETKQYYEVIAGYSGFIERKNVILLLLLLGYKINVVKPDGTTYKPAISRIPLRKIISELVRETAERGKTCHQRQHIMIQKESVLQG